MIEFFKGTWQWIKDDYRESPIRCILEITAWAMSLFCSIVMAITVPEPPFLALYPIFITQCVIFCWAAWTRRSAGMMSNYVLLVTIDSFAFVRLLVA